MSDVECHSNLVQNVRVYLLAGGFGTRLSGILGDVPKPMAEISGTPFLEWQINWYREHGLRDIVLLVGHKREKIINYFQDGSRFGVTIRYSVEETPLGTGGALINALRAFPTEYFVAANADCFFDIDIDWALHYCFRRIRHGSLCLALKYKEIASRYGTVRVSDDYKIVDYCEKDDCSQDTFINGGIYIGHTDAFRQYPVQCISLENDIFPQLTAKQRLYGVPFGGKFIDIGIPESYGRANRYLKTWFSARKRRPIFLDRDGVVIEDTGYVSKADDIEFIEENLEIIKVANAKGYKVIVISNQAGVGKGFITEDDVQSVNEYISEHLAKVGLKIDQFYYCPHHEEATIPAYRKSTLLRKPQPAMLLKAIEEHNLDPTDSLMVGDKDSDIIKLPYVKSCLLQGRYEIQNTESLISLDQLLGLL